MSNIQQKQRVALVVDDEKSICDSMAGALMDEGWQCETAASGTEALAKIKRKTYDLVFLDIWMPGPDGIETLQKIKGEWPGIPVVIMSGHGTIETAVRATKLGAYEFVEKPLSLEKIIPLLEQFAGYKPIESGAAGEQDLDMVGTSAPIRGIRQHIEMVAPRNSWVLITGENGTGKEVVARQIHRKSIRYRKPFVAVNCAAIPEDLIESELFGHERGAFTNAVATKRGKFELADSGTLFLDEIGDMSLKTQAKVLRILQEQTFERLGGQDTISVDVRVIAATNKDLRSEIIAGRFREDLFYRLNVIPIQMPPLRDRIEDIPALAHFFLSKMAQELKEPEKKLAECAQAALIKHSWPGNVRELKNLVERLSILVPGPLITKNDLPASLQEAEPVPLATNPMIDGGATLKQARSDFERNYIVERLQENQWNVSRAAESLGIERSHLHRKLRTYGIDTKRLRDD